MYLVIVTTRESVVFIFLFKHLIMRFCHATERILHFLPVIHFQINKKQTLKGGSVIIHPTPAVFQRSREL